MNVLVTREEEKYQILAEKMKAFGLTPFSLPMIECSPVGAIITGEYDYAVFTSLNSAKYFKPHISRVTINKVVAVGPSTAAALLDIDIKTDIMPETFSAEGMKELFATEDVEGKKFLFAGAKVRAGDFHEYLRGRGAEPVMVATYQTQPVKYPPGYIEAFLKENKIDIVTFASPSAARAMLADIQHIDQQIVCIGKTTADEVRLLGYDSRYPDDYTLDWMVRLIKELS
ncbi:uroporphyrinogen-III synthase [Deferribacteres bacterium DY0037]